MTNGLDEWRGKITPDLKTIKERIMSLAQKIDGHLEFCHGMTRQFCSEIQKNTNGIDVVKSGQRRIVWFILAVALGIVGTAAGMVLFGK